MHQRPVLLVRTFSSLFCLGLLTQMGLAVAFLGGSVEAYALHGSMAWPLVALGIVQAAVLAFSSGMARAVVVVAVLLSIALLVQIILGQSVRTAAHVSNGFLIWGLALALLIRAWRPDGLAPQK